MDSTVKLAKELRLCIVLWVGRRFRSSDSQTFPQVLGGRKSCSLAGTRRTSGLGKAGATIRRSSYEIAFIRVPCYCCYCSSAGVRNAAAAGGRIAELEVTPVLSMAREECEERGRGESVGVLGGVVLWVLPLRGMP